MPLAVFGQDDTRQRQHTTAQGNTNNTHKIEDGQVCGIAIASVGALKVKSWASEIYIINIVKCNERDKMYRKIYKTNNQIINIVKLFLSKI